MKGSGNKDIVIKLTAVVCAIVLVLVAGAAVLSGVGSVSVDSIVFPSPSPSAVPSPSAEAVEAVSDEELAYIAMPFDDTGLSLMPENFEFTEVSDPENIVEDSSLRPGVHDERVIEIKERLMDRGFLGADDPSDYYGEQTAYAVQLFQRACEIEITGAIDDETYALLMSEDAPLYLLNVGLNGTDVEEAQKRLKKLGYLTVKVTGYFGGDTEKAVKAFQKNNGLTVDGCIGSQTREVLYSSDAKKAPSASKSPKPSPSPSKSKEPENTEPTPSKETQKPTESKEPSSGLPSPDSAKVEKFIEYAQTLMGKPYVLGGKGPDKFDCSGFIYYALNKSGVMSINYMTSAGWKRSAFPTVKKSELERGDILCYDGPNGTGHVGIYLGNQKMLDASSDEGKIRITSNIWSKNYWNKYFKFGKRALY